MYESELEEYVLTVRGKKAQEQTRKGVKGVISVMEVCGHSWPDKTDYEKYRARIEYKDKSKGKKNTQEEIKQAGKFFDWLKRTKENERMTDEGTMTAQEEEATIPAGYNDVDEAECENEAETLPVNEPGADDEPDRKKPSTDKRQISVYLECATYDTLQAMSSITGKSMGKIAAEACDELARKNSEATEKALKALQEIRQGFSIEF